jgi:hypothetical protein
VTTLRVRKTSRKGSRPLDGSWASSIMELRRHLSIPGIVQIAEIAETMSHRKPSQGSENPQRPYAGPLRQPA